jgi:hypothetical protein
LTDVQKQIKETSFINESIYIFFSINKTEQNFIEGTCGVPPMYSRCMASFDENLISRAALQKIGFDLMSQQNQKQK